MRVNERCGSTVYPYQRAKRSRDYGEDQQVQWLSDQSFTGETRIPGFLCRGRLKFFDDLSDNYIEMRDLHGLAPKLQAATRNRDLFRTKLQHLVYNPPTFGAKPDAVVQITVSLVLAYRDVLHA